MKEDGKAVKVNVLVPFRFTNTAQEKENSLKANRKVLKEDLLVAFPFIHAVQEHINFLKEDGKTVKENGMADQKADHTVNRYCHTAGTSCIPAETFSKISQTVASLTDFT